MSLGRVDVVCVAYGDVEGLAASLRSALSTEIASITVVDHGAPGAAAAAAEVGAICLEDRDNPGFGAGQNRGVAAGASEVLLLLNPDCVLEPGFMAAGLRRLDEDARTAMVQGVITNSLTRSPERSQGVELGPLHLWGRALGARRLLRLRCVRALVRRSGVLSDHVQRVPSEAIEVESLAATAVLVRREAFESVGGFDEGYFLYGEDLDLCRRLRHAGWRLVSLPVPGGQHVGGGSAEGWMAREITWWEGTMRFAAVWWSQPAFALGIGAAAVRSASLALRSPRDASQVARRVLVQPMRWRRERGA